MPVVYPCAHLVVHCSSISVQAYSNLFATSQCWMLGGQGPCHAYLWIKCSPDAVSTTLLTWPFSSANDASSNSFCISPRPKKPLSCVSVQPRLPPSHWGPALAALTGRLPCVRCCSPTRWLPAPRATWLQRRYLERCPRMPGSEPHSPRSACAPPLWTW